MRMLHKKWQSLLFYLTIWMWNISLSLRGCLYYGLQTFVEAAGGIELQSCSQGWLVRSPCRIKHNSKWFSQWLPQDWGVQRGGSDSAGGDPGRRKTADVKSKKGDEVEVERGRRFMAQQCGETRRERDYCLLESGNLKLCHEYQRLQLHTLSASTLKSQRNFSSTNYTPITLALCALDCTP